MRNNYYDERLNIRQPMAAVRIVWSVADIDYERPSKPTETLAKLMELLAEESVKAYPPHIRPEVLRQSGRAKKLQAQYDGQVEEGQRRLMNERRQQQKLRTMHRKNTMEEIMSGKRKQTKEEMLKLQALSDDNFLTKQEEALQGKTACRFPERPVVKFIPSRQVLHDLLIEAAMTSYPNLEKELVDAKGKKK